MWPFAGAGEREEGGKTLGVGKTACTHRGAPVVGAQSGPPILHLYFRFMRKGGHARREAAPDHVDDWGLAPMPRDVLTPKRSSSTSALSELSGYWQSRLLGRPRSSVAFYEALRKQ